MMPYSNYLTTYIASVSYFEVLLHNKTTLNKQLISVLFLSKFCYKPIVLALQEFFGVWYSSLHYCLIALFVLIQYVPVKFDKNKTTVVFCCFFIRYLDWVSLIIFYHSHVLHNLIFHVFANFGFI